MNALAETKPWGQHDAWPMGETTTIPLWYVVCCEPRQENLAAAHMLGHRIATYQPLAYREEAHGRGRKRNVLRPMFPGYLFALFDMAKDPWKRIYSLPGVHTIMPYRNDPLPVSPADMAWIQKAAENALEEQKKGRSDHHGKAKAGDPVRLLDGPFTGFVGEVECFVLKTISGEIRALVRVLVDIFGRKTPVELEFEQIELR